VSAAPESTVVELKKVLNALAAWKREKSKKEQYDALDNQGARLEED
jgi:hypothetical protein